MDRMTVTLQRDRFLNSILYFVAETRQCNWVKSFRLLCLLEIEHFRQTGRGVTGVCWNKREEGLFPDCCLRRREDLAPHVVDAWTGNHYQDLVIKDGGIFDEEAFTPRQLRIMAKLAEHYRDTPPLKMIDAIKGQFGSCGEFSDAFAMSNDIPYREEILAIATEHSMYEAALAASRQSAFIAT